MVNEKRLKFAGVTKWFYTFPVGQNFNTLDKLTKVTVALKIENGFGSTYAPEHLYEGPAQVKLRGNSTALYPKRPASVTFVDGAGKKVAVPLLGMPATSGWNQLASAQDKTFMRTVFTHPAARVAGLTWSARCRHIAVYWKNEGDAEFQYYGLFTITEKIESGPNMSDIPETKTLDTGYLIEQQNFDQLSETEGRFQDSVLGLWHGFKIPDGDKVTVEQVAHAKAIIENWYSNTLTKTNWKAITDILSLISYLDIQDEGKNSDLYQTSWMLKITPAGIVGGGYFWDADGCWAVASVNGDGNQLDNPRDTYATVKVPYFAKMMEDTEFAEARAAQHRAKQPEWQALISDFVPYSEALYATGLVEADRFLYPAILEDEFFIPLPDYQAEVARVYKFIRNRAYYFTRSLYDVIPRKNIA